MSHKFIEIVLFGDSLTWSARAPYGQRYADFVEAGLQARLGAGWIVDVAACGDGGNMAAEGLARIERDVIAYAPHIVVINFGANDAGRAPSRESFMAAYLAVLDTIREQSRAVCVLETIPGVDPERHAWRNRVDIARTGGVEAHLEKFTNTFIRSTAADRHVPLHDRFASFHTMLEHDQTAWTRLIRSDGVHLTLAGNKVFGETLADILFSIVSKSDIAAKDQDATAWLEKALNNPILIKCRERLSNDQSLDDIEEGCDAARLMLQQSRSCARRAGVLAKNQSVARKALIAERLAAGLLAWMRMRNKHVIASVITDNLAWARAQLKPICDHAPAANLLRRLEDEARGHKPE